MAGSASALLKYNFFNISQFKKDIIDYCKSQQYDLHFTDAEIEQLSWLLNNKYLSPEAHKNQTNNFDHIPYEIKRGIARRYSFELLLGGQKEDYLFFIKGQEDKLKLSFNQFQALSKEANALDEDSHAAIRASTIIVKSNQLQAVCKEKINDVIQNEFSKNNLSTVLSDDGEEFISQFAIIVGFYPAITPLTRTLTKEQNQLLLKAFWPKLHMRWLYSSEGGVNMTSTLVKGIESKQFNLEKDFPIWIWRWRLNVAGFQGEPAGKFYDQASHDLIENMLSELRGVFANPSYQFLHNYLRRNAKNAGIINSEEKANEFSKKEIYFFGHLVAYLAYFHRINIFSSANAQALIKGYKLFKQEFPEDSVLVDNYNISCLNENAVTPTYVPGAMDTAMGLFKYHANQKIENHVADEKSEFPDAIDISSLFKSYPENEPEVICNSVQFMCQLLSPVYKTGLSKRIVCMDIAKTENLKSTLQAWLTDHKSLRFEFSDNMDVFEKSSQITSLPRVKL